MSQNNQVIVILGPTASGKTGLGVKLARELDGEIISADSRQVYRGMDVGSGKDLAEYSIDPPPLTKGRVGVGSTIKIPYHLIDVVDPQETFDVAQYKQLAQEAIADILSRGKVPIVVGGSGLYLQALVDDYDLPDIKPNLKLRQELEQKTLTELQTILQAKNQAFFDKLNNSDRNNKRRLIRYIEIFNQDVPVGPSPLPRGRTGGGLNNQPYNFLLLGLTWPQEILYQRIEKRLKERLENEDMIEEVKTLHDQGVSWDRLESFGLEYKFIAQYLQEKLDYETMFDRLNLAIRQFTKRQLTWFKRWEKQGKEIHWISNYEEALKIIKRN